MKRIIKKAVSPLRFLLSDSRGTGILLIICTIFSLLLSNLLIGDWYRGLWNHEIEVFSSLHLPQSFGHWINDFLMAFFFLLAGMEIKRELLAGELSTFKKAVLPFGAALGGMIVPALIFLLINKGSAFSSGWGIPTATDIAFSIGVASLFGKRIPVELKILLMALAIIDDLGAIVVIALFYGGKIHAGFLIGAAVVYALLWILNIRKVKFGALHIVLSFVLWYFMFNSGIEAGITGVLVAFALPVKDLAKVENVIHKPVNFAIIPLFAMANTALLINGNISDTINSTIATGVIAGLVIGKPVGIFLFSRLLVLLKVAHLPRNVNWQQIFFMGSLAGIGFTMSIFTTSLAFKGEASKDIAKLAILASVLISIIVSSMIFVLMNRVRIDITTTPAVPETQPELAMG